MTKKSYWPCITLAFTLLASCAGAQQITATYSAVTGPETDRLTITVTRGSMTLTGIWVVSLKQTDGTTRSRQIPITGRVDTDGVPSTITIPSYVMGVPDQTLGCFFDKSLNLELVGDNRRPYPHIMYLVK
jgi:prenyltransferase beta subunit